MEGNNQEELIEELLIVETLIKENPCRMKGGLMGALKEVLHSFIGKHCIEGASRDQVATYLHRDVRTLSRWAKEYPDFPQARHEGHREVCYHWHDVVQWKLKHKELFKE